MHDELYILHKRYAPSYKLLDLVWSHSRIVADIVLQFIERRSDLPINKSLAVHGALLHDIGVYTVPFESYKDTVRWDRRTYITHGINSGDIVRQAGLGESLGRLVERHIGVGITKEEIMQKHLPLPLKDFLPETLEEKIVAYADNFHSKIPLFNNYEDIRIKLSRYHKGNERRLDEMRNMFGLPDIWRIHH